MARREEAPKHHQVIGDERTGQAEGLLHLVQQVQHLCQRRHVEGGDVYAGNRNGGNLGDTIVPVWTLKFTSTV
jgi:hypothetical protein